ncbi:cysteine-rich receptor-like protein kinase 10 [Tanacetum coccineum]
MDILIRSLFLFSPLMFTFYQTTAQYNFWANDCGVSGNYTLGSTYKSDLDNVLNFLTRRNNGFGFYNSTSGQANAAAFCRGDMEPETCQNCVAKASRQLPQDCPNQIEAGIWYEPCLLRYSNQPMGYGIDDSFGLAYNSDIIPNSSYHQWKQTIENMLGELRPEAAAGGKLRKYASRSIAANGSVPPIDGYMQCSPDLLSTECDYCLVEATKEARTYDKSVGIQVYNPSCILRYEIYSFLNPTCEVVSSLIRKRKSTNIGIIVGPILAMLVVTAIVIFIYKQRLQKQKRGSLLPELQDGLSNSSLEGNEHEGEDEGTREMNLFKFRTIEVATNNFSAENKLGEGGFGPVYKGELQDGKEIAVKRLSSNSGQGVQEFKTEVQLIIKLQHKNLVRLLGYCIKRSERLLVYEFMANNSVETFLSGLSLLDLLSHE